MNDIRMAGIKDIPIIKRMAEQVFPETYKDIIIHVNRYNKARTFYEHLGMSITKQGDYDIGNGYFMNDYIMEKEI